MFESDIITKTKKFHHLNELKRGTVTQIKSYLTYCEKYFSDVGQSVYKKRRKNCRKSFKFSQVEDFLNFAEEKNFRSAIRGDFLATCNWIKIMVHFLRCCKRQAVYSMPPESGCMPCAGKLS